MKIPKIAIQQGAAAGLILVVIKSVAFLMGIEAMMSGWVGFGQLVLVVAGMFLACSMERKQGGGLLSFGQAFGVALAAAAVTTFMGFALDVVLGTLVDPFLGEKIIERTMEEFETSGLLSIIPESELEKAQSELEWATQPTGQFVSWLLGLLFWGVVALVTGAIMKKNDSEQF